jgi:tetratricopeptide (TPR) repeat protein
MALQQKPRDPRTRLAVGLDEPEGTKQGDLHRLLDHARQNPLLYLASVAFVVVCLVAGAMYGLYDSTRMQEIQTAYAAALQEEDPALVAAALEALVDSGGAWTPEIWYMLGEFRLRAQAYGKAEEAFTTVVDKFPKSEYAPKALDGLGFIHENRGDFQKALEAYRSILADEGYAASLVGLRQEYNIGRVLEKMERFEDAKVAYEKQLDLFPGTVEEPSIVSQQARSALDRMRTEHPELFPEDVVAEGEASVVAPAASTEASAEVAPEVAVTEEAAPVVAPEASTEAAAPVVEAITPEAATTVEVPAAESPATEEDAVTEEAPVSEPADVETPAEAPETPAP